MHLQGRTLSKELCHSGLLRFVLIAIYLLLVKLLFTVIIDYCDAISPCCFFMILFCVVCDVHSASNQSYCFGGSGNWEHSLL